MIFKRVATFNFDNKTYQMFSTSRKKLAFLRIENNLYHYPTIEEFKKLINVLETEYKDSYAYYNDKRKKNYRFKPFLINVAGNKIKKVMITSLLVFSCLTGCGSTQGYQSYYYEPLDIDYSEDAEEYETQNTTYSNGFYETEDFEMLESSKIVSLYNNKYFDDLFGYTNVGINEVMESLESNKNIPDEYNYYINEFITVMNSYYTSLEFRVFDYNLKTLDFEIRKPDDVDFVSGGALAYYDIQNNKMIISTDLDLRNDPKSRLIFRHELGHLFNHLKITKDGYSIDYAFNDAGRGTYLKEAMNVIFTTDPFMYDYDDPKISENMGYPIITNIVRVLTECSGYNICDSISSNVYTFQDQLNEYYSDEIDASIIEELIEIQWIEYSDDLIQVNDSDYEDLYEYVTKVYIKKNVNPSMTYEEIQELEKTLEERLLLGVSHDEYVYIYKVKEVFKEYLTLNNIIKTSVRKM